MTKPVRLEKQEEYGLWEQLEGWLLQHSPIILILLIILLLLLIGTVIGVMVSSGNLTMTESNNYFYHLKDVV